MKGKVSLFFADALYELKSSGVPWRKHLASSLNELGFERTRGDPDVSIRPAKSRLKKTIMTTLLIYVDDILFVSYYTTLIMHRFFLNMYRLKEGSVGPPFSSLGADIAQRHTGVGVKCWAMSSHF